MPSARTVSRLIVRRLLGFTGKRPALTLLIVFCPILAAAWVLSILTPTSFQRWHLAVEITSTATTCVLIGVLYGMLRRSNEDAQHKLDEIAIALAEVIDVLDSSHGGRTRHSHRFSSPVGQHTQTPPHADSGRRT